MKKFKHLLICLLGVITIAISVISCDKKEEIDIPTPPAPPTPEDSTSYYKISYTNESLLYKVTAPESACEGELVEVEVKTLIDGVNIISVLFNENQTTIGESHQNTSVYTFTMPAEDVELTVENSCDIILQDDYYYTVTSDKSNAKYNETVNVTFSVSNPKYKIAGATFNENECTFVSKQGDDYLYSFIMPDTPVTVAGYIQENQLLIERTWDENCVVVMLDCINNQGTPEEYCSQAPGELVHFIEKHDLGYEVTLSVTGIESGTDYTSSIYWSLAADNHLYQDSWAFIMPQESVVISARSTEIEIYKDEPFVGVYNGYQISVGANNIYTSDLPNMTLNLKANSAYSLLTTDENEFNSEGLYTYSQNRFDYVIESCTNDLGARGEFIGNDFIFTEVHYLLYDNVDNTRYYFAGKSGFDYTCASRDQYGTFFLIEAKNETDSYYYYIDKERRTISAVEVDFEYGNSIGDYSSAKVSLNGDLFMKYNYSSESAEEPIFTYRGKEYGTYTSINDGSLFLDGFGTGEYNGTTATYTINGTIVSFGTADELIQFNIDLNNKTFTLINNTKEWGYYTKYTLNNAQISLSGQISTNGVVTIQIDKNLMGSTKEGYAAIQIQYPGSFGRLSDMVSDCQPYYFDENTSTLTITNVLQGTGTNYSTIRKDITLTVSQDKSQMTFDAEYIFSTSTPYEYLFGGQTNTIIAVE